MLAAESISAWFRLRNGGYFRNPISDCCRKSVALALCSVLLCSAFQPCLLAQTPVAAIAPPMLEAKPAKPAPPASPKQIKLARKYFAKGTAALKKGESDQAFHWLSQAHELVPDDVQYLANQEIARQQRVAKLLLLAEKQQNSGAHDAALGTLQQAQNIDPDNPFVREHIQVASQTLDPQFPATARLAPLPELDSGVITLAATTTPESFHLRASAQDLIHRVFESYGITVMLDDSVPNTSVRLDMDNVSFASASTAVQLVTDTFVVPLDAHRVLVAKDTVSNRKQFERQLMETLYLPGLTSKQMIDAVNLVKNVFGVKQVGSIPENSTISVRAPESILRAINLTVAGLYQGIPEVLLDVRVYQVNDSRDLNLGTQLPQQFTIFNVPSEIQNLIQSNQSLINQLISSGLVSPGDYAAIAALLVFYGLASGSILSQPFALFGNGLTLSGITFGTVTVNASLNVSTAKQIDHVQLRAENEETSSFLFGSRYPIITASYSGAPATPNIPGLGGFAGLGANSTNSGLNALAMAPQVQYENLGLTLKATPQIERDRHVRMKLEVKIEALAGSALNGIPVLGSRAFISDIDIRDGESALLVSSMTRQESNVLSGIPGLTELPGMSWTGSKSTQVTVGDLVLVVTPHIVNASPSSVASSMISLPYNEK